MPNLTNNPPISLLVAARNEEHNILNLLRTIDELDYPKEKMQVLLGDDASTDLTVEVISSFIQDKPYMTLYHIRPAMPAMDSSAIKGKANVLCQLADLATGDYFFFTDADIQLPPTWIQTMLNNFQEHVGVVVGCTTTVPTSLFARCQGIEWLTVLFFMEICGRFKIPTTGMGNNMAVSKKAYHAVGGYAAIPFSIVEDFALYNAIIKHGYGFKHIYNPEILALTQPPENYFNQRKRWVSGGVTSGSMLIVLALLQAFVLPGILFLSFISTKAAWALGGFSLVLNAILGSIALIKMNFFKWLPYIAAYALYVNIFWLLQFVYYLWPSRINWKNRHYE